MNLIPDDYYRGFTQSHPETKDTYIKKRCLELSAGHNRDIFLADRKVEAFKEESIELAITCIERIYEDLALLIPVKYSVEESGFTRNLS